MPLHLRAPASLPQKIIPQLFRPRDFSWCARVFQNFNSSDPGAGVSGASGARPHIPEDRAGDVRRGAHLGAAEAGACRESLVAGLKMRLQSAALKLLLIFTPSWKDSCRR
jgi:hypothetical protein